MICCRDGAFTFAFRCTAFSFGVFGDERMVSLLAKAYM